MGKCYDGTAVILICLVSAIFVNCIPTSVLANSKASITTDNNKVKRDSNSNPIAGNEKPIEHLEEKKGTPQKRGVRIHQDIPENNVYANGMSNGYWEDTESGLVYPEIKEFDEYQPNPLPYRSNNNAYESLQKILNGYEEPIALPIQYPTYSRFYPDRKKRSYEGLRKDSKLSPAEMVALLELIEDRSRMDNSPYGNNNLDFQNSPYELPASEDNGEWWNSNVWPEPSAQYYGNPYYNIESQYGDYPTKRYIVAKKKRSLSSRGTDKRAETGGFDSRFRLSELNKADSQKQHAKHF